ncbi:MAG TPA: hypothetical protein VE053_06880 [Allosphingosinicella sp.]|nr:hypothetical protein [Allosphingosinicella sp.]
MSAAPTSPVVDGWNPRPDPNGTKFNDAAYLCGYTDGFYGEPFGSHDDGKYGAFSDYRPGFSDGRADAKNAEVSAPSPVVDKWRPIDTARPGAKVEGLAGAGKIIKGRIPPATTRGQRGWNTVIDSDGMRHVCTHWRPLPKPPVKS